MTKVSLRYNPYTVETEIAIDGVDVQSPHRLFDLKRERLQVWIENLIPILDETCNDDEYEIEFYGTRLDFNDLDVVIKDYCSSHPDIRVNIVFTEAKGSEDRFSELVDLFDDMQENCPFEDLKTEQIRENFQSAISSEFEVSVIATMSSGKSTLINSLLGRELLPSKNEACTATIARIKDVDGMEDFSATYRSRENKLLGSFDKLCLDNMYEMNANPDTACIDIEGDIPNIDSSGVQLVLVDTPGPNSSENEDHKACTRHIIEEKTKPMVLYVLNGTQLSATDDNVLLNNVANAMKVGGKQSKDRFLFVVNKMDEFDPEKESVQGALDNVRKYLKKFKIENPNIFPASAEVAKVIRMYQNKQELTRKQKDTLNRYAWFRDDEQLHLSEQASLSKDNLQKVKAAIKKAKEEEDEYQEALIHTGIPAVEMAIDEYLRKYAYTIKVKAAVDTFRKKVEEKDMHAKMMASIQNDEKARTQINSQLKAVKELLEEGKAGKEFRDKINRLDMMREAEARIRCLQDKVISTANNREQKEEMTALEFQQMMMKLDQQIRNLQSDVRTELENIIEDVILETGKTIIEEYKKHMHRLISSGELTADSYSADCNINFLEEDIPDAQELINQYKYVDKVDTGETERVKNTDKHWWNPFTWFESSYYTRTIYKDVEMVNVEEVYNEYMEPVIGGLFKNLANAKKTAQAEAEKFKNYFIKELDSLDEILKKKVEMNEELTRNQKNIEDRIKEDKTKVEWLESFMKRLDEILAI